MKHFFSQPFRIYLKSEVSLYYKTVFLLKDDNHIFEVQDRHEGLNRI